MTNDEINRRVAEIMDPMPSEPPAVFDVNNETPGGAWWYDVMDETGWQPLDFCTDIAAAWRCVEWAKGVAHVYKNGDRWWASFGHIIDGDNWDEDAWDEADTAPMAITLAFIAAFGGE